MPTYEAVDYFARAVGAGRETEEEPPERPEELVTEMKQAVFEDGLAPGALRRRFHPVLYPKSEEDERRELLRKLKSSAQRLEGLLQDVEGLTEARVEEVTTALEGLREDLEALSDDDG